LANPAFRVTLPVLGTAWTSWSICFRESHKADWVIEDDKAMKSIYRILFALSLTLLLISPAIADAPALPPTVKEEAHFQGLIDKTAYFEVKGEKISFVIPETAKDLLAGLNKFTAGDLLILEKVKDSPDVLKSVEAQAFKLSRWRRVWILFFSLIGYWLLLWSLGRFFKKKNVLLGEDGRYSNSKFQIALWFGVLIMSYIDTVVLRWWYCENCFLAGISIPDNLLLSQDLALFHLPEPRQSPPQRWMRLNKQLRRMPEKREALRIQWL